MHYSGYTIVRAYGCNGELVFGEDAPTPTGMTGLKVSGTTLAEPYAVECDDYNTFLGHDIPQTARTATVTKIEVGTCINTIGANSLNLVKTPTEIILPSTITSFGTYSFLSGNEVIQRLVIYATTPPRFSNYDEETYEWEDIFGYRYPSSKAPEGFKIYVPAESLNAYKTAEGWSHMENYFEAI